MTVLKAQICGSLAEPAGLVQKSGVCGISSVQFLYSHLLRRTQLRDILIEINDREYRERQPERSTISLVACEHHLFEFFNRIGQKRTYAPSKMKPAEAESPTPVGD